MVQTQPVNL